MINGENCTTKKGGIQLNKGIFYALITGIIVVITAMAVLVVTYGQREEVKDVLDSDEAVLSDSDTQENEN